MWYIKRQLPSTLESGDEIYKHGFEDGRVWAENHAEYIELKRLADFQLEFYADPSLDWDEIFDSSFGSSTFSAGEGLADILLGEQTLALDRGKLGRMYSEMRRISATMT